MRWDTRQRRSEAEPTHSIFLNPLPLCFPSVSVCSSPVLIPWQSAESGTAPHVGKYLTQTIEIKWKERESEQPNSICEAHLSRKAQAGANMVASGVSICQCVSNHICIHTHTHTHAYRHRCGVCFLVPRSVSFLGAANMLIS